MVPQRSVSDRCEGDELWQESKTLQGKALVPKVTYNGAYPLAAALERQISRQGLAYAVNKYSSLVTLHLIKKKRKIFKEAKIRYKEMVFCPFPSTFFFLVFYISVRENKSALCYSSCPWNTTVCAFSSLHVLNKCTFQNPDPTSLLIFKFLYSQKCFTYFGEESTRWKSFLFQILPLCEIICIF